MRTPVVRAPRYPPPPAMSDELVGELARLFVLHKAGGLGEREFSDAKADLPGLPGSPDTARRLPEVHTPDVSQAGAGMEESQ